MATTTLQTLDAEQCRRLLEAHRLHLGRVGFADSDGPVVLPVNYRFDGAAVWIRTAADSPVAAATGQTVAFEVDAVDEAWQEGWSVLVRGRLDQPDPAELSAVTRQLHTWAGSERDRFLRLRVEQISGRRIV